MNIDLKTFTTIVGLLICFSGLVSTWVLLQYRIDELEKDTQETNEELKKLTVEFRDKGQEVHCLICQAHKMQCPGC